MVQKIQRTNPFNRPPRLQHSMKPLELDIPTPPSRSDETTRNILISLLPMTSILVMGIFYAIIYSSSGRSGSAIFAIPMIAMGIISAIASLVIFSEQKHQQQIARIKQLQSYHRTLDRKEARLLSSRLVQLDLLENQFPCLSAIQRRVLDFDLRLWERRPADPDFLTLRIGTGEIPANVQIKPPDPDLPEKEIRRAFGIYSEFKELPNAPITTSLHEVDSIAIVGARTLTLPYVYGLIAQISSLTSPEDAIIFLFSSIQSYKQWEWMRWLPHTSQRTGELSHSMAFRHEDNKYLFSLLSRLISSRVSTNSDVDNEEHDQDDAGFIISIFDGDMDLRSEPGFPLLVNQGSQLRSASIFLCNTLEEVPSDCKAVIQLQTTKLMEYWQVGPQGKKMNGVPEFMSLIRADNFAHRILDVATVSQGLANRIPRAVNLLQTYELNKLDELDIQKRWMRLPPKNGLLPFPVLIGNESRMNPLSIHLAEQHDGPHGLVAGTTGSGKSELLQTLIVSLALEHHPYYVNFLLIDFKGGSAFGIFKDLPHTVGTISNLDKSTALRALEAIKAEIVRRQEFLNRLNLKDISDYHRELTQKEQIPSDWEPLPHLFIIVDEFAQLAKEMPTFLPELIATLRLGRSLGMHLVLATQRPAGAITDEMRSNLNFRICLRVQTIEDSRDVLSGSDAANLPKDLPGRAYFQVGDTGTPRQFQSSYIGGEYSETVKDETVQFYVVQYEQRVQIQQESLLLENQKEAQKRPTLAKLLVERINSTYEEMKRTMHYSNLRQILLPQLPQELSLKNLIGETPAYQPWWKSSSDEYPEDIKVLLGKIDNLFNTTQPPMILEFPGKRGGNLVILGAPGSGKTVFLRTLASSLAYHYSPSQVQMYILSFAGRGLDSLKNLAQVGDVIHGNEPERISRLLRFLRGTIEERKVLMGSMQTDSLAKYNHHPRLSPEKRLPAIFVLIDNFGELRDQEFVDELDEIQKLIENGRNYGVFFIMTALQIGGIPYKLLNLIDQRIALNLTDKADYSIFVGRLHSLEFDFLPPGRGFLFGTSPQSIQLADIGDTSVDENTIGGYGHQSTLFQEIIAAGEKWSGNSPQTIGILPEWINISSIYSTQDQQPGAIGVDSDSLCPLRIEWTPGMHLLIGGPPQSGRTSILHSIALSIMDQYSPDKAWFVLVDGAQGSLRSLINFKHVLNWVIDEDTFKEPIACLESEMRYRRQLITDGRVLKESKLFVLIDDYDLTRDAIAIRQEILTTLARYMRRDSDLDIHFIISGISQKIAHENDPVIRQMKLARTGFSLVDIETMEALGGRPTGSMRKQELPVGRGYYLRAGKLLSIAQFAFPDQAFYDRVFNKYPNSTKAKWLRPAPSEMIDKVVIQQNLTAGGDGFDVSFDVSSQELAETYRKLRLKEMGRDS